MDEPSNIFLAPTKWYAGFGDAVLGSACVCFRGKICGSDSSVGEYVQLQPKPPGTISCDAYSRADGRTDEEEAALRRKLPGGSNKKNESANALQNNLRTGTQKPEPKLPGPQF